MSMPPGMMPGSMPPMGAGAPGGAPPFGSTAPAAVETPKEGQAARGRITAGLGAEMLRLASNMFPLDSDEYVSLSEAALKMAKMFRKPPEDLGAAELKYLASQLYPQGGSPLQGGAAQSLQQVGAGQPMAGGPPPIPIPELPQRPAV